MTRLNQDGIQVNSIRGAWLQGTDSVNYSQYTQGIANGLAPEQAALNTWTGKLAQQYGYTQVQSVEQSSGNIYALFARPKQN